MKNIYIYILILILLIGNILFVYFLFNIESFNIQKKIIYGTGSNGTGSNLTGSNLTGSVMNKSSFSLDDALKGNKTFNYYINSIIENFNLSNLLIDEFKKVTNVNEFNEFEKKYGSQNILIIFSKTGNKNGFLKYFNFFIDQNNITTKTGFTKKELLTKLENIINNIKINGFFDSNYIDSKGNYDNVLISFLSYNLEKKISLCKKGFSIKDEYNNCTKFVTIMSSSSKKNYCFNLSYDFYSMKLCEDILLSIE